jgi:hypothetical protein
MKACALVMLTIGFAFLSVPTFAHHGEARYDTSRLITLKGTVTQFQFSNPHAELEFETRNANGKVEVWMAEATSPNMLSRVGWNRSTLKPGDMITAQGYPGKGGSRILLIDKITLPNGQSLDGHVQFGK